MKSAPAAVTMKKVMALAAALARPMRAWTAVAMTRIWASSRAAAQGGSGAGGGATGARGGLEER